MQNSEALSDRFSIYRNCIHISFAQKGNKIIDMLMYIYLCSEGVNFVLASYFILCLQHNFKCVVLEISS
jgi:hypothetical protein